MDLGRNALMILAFLAFLAAPLAAQPHFLAADVNQVEIDGGSEPHDFVIVGDVVYFSASDDLHGEELWRTDGTAEGTRRVRDVCPGQCGSRPKAMTAVDDQVFFLAYSGGARGRNIELWKSDGTAAGTELMGTVCRAGCGYGYGYHMVAFEGEAYFVGNDGECGDELWKSDGTAEGTGMVLDILPGAVGSQPRDLEVFDGRLFFGARGELWSSDGTAEGTQLFADLCPGSCSSRPRDLHASLLPGALLFSAWDEAAGREMWISDGTPEGTGMLADLRPGADGLDPESFVSFGGQVYFLDLDYGENPGVWKTDGTPAGTVPAPELLPLGPDGWTYQLRTAGSLLFFALWIDEGLENQLWVSDGSAAGTRPLADFSYPPALGLALGDRLTIVGDDHSGEAREGLWISDGTPEGTVPLRHVDPDRAGFWNHRVVVHQGRLLFAADDGRAGEELWRSDGTAGGTEMVTEIRPPVGSSDPAQMAALGDRIFFTARDGGSYRPLWRSAGTDRGAEIVEEGQWLTEPPVALSGRLFFAAWDLAYPRGYFLWVTGGRPGDAVPLAPQRARQLTVHDGVLIYSLVRPGQQLWRTDGTPGGTYLLKDVHPDWINCTSPPGPPDCPFPPMPDHLVSSGPFVYFLAFEDVALPQLWRSDGTTSGTVVMADFDYFPHQLTDLGEKLIFVGFAGDSGWEPWVSDGTPDGTMLLADLAPADASSNPRLLTRAGERVFFVLAGAGDELWSTDGTAAGTLPVDDLRLDGAGGRTRFPTAVGKRLFFTVEHQATGEELWVSDGTAAGTGLVADLLPGPGSSRPSALTAVGNLLLFAADDGAFGKEVWISDGSAAGTRRLADVMPGSGASDPSEFTIVGERVFFAAGDVEHGHELWAVDASALCVGELCAASGPALGGGRDGREPRVGRKGD